MGIVPDRPWTELSTEFSIDRVILSGSKIPVLGSFAPF
jgi:hypothetical protein